MVFRDRREAGRDLVRLLFGYARRPDVLVLGLARGGVPVAFEVARVLRVPLDVVLVGKLEVPAQPGLVMGAIASGGVLVLDQGVVRVSGLTATEIEALVTREQEALQWRERACRGARPAPDVAGRTILLVDDGLETGSSIRTAILALRQAHPARIVVAAPVGSREACEELEQIVGEVVCVRTSDPFGAVGACYRDFAPVLDEEVSALLDAAAREREPKPAR